MSENRENMLFIEPNAYIMKYKKEHTQLKKVVFQEPYENMPNHYINNNFQKRNCDCVPKEKINNNSPCVNQTTSPFDFSSLSSIFSNMGNFFSGGIGNLISMLSNNAGANNSLNNGANTNFDVKNLMSLFGGAQGLGNIFNLFKIGNKSFNSNVKMKQNAGEMKTTEIPIKEYTRVD